MFILQRLISASCRSLAAMIGCAASRGRRGRSGESGSPDDTTAIFLSVALRRLHLSPGAIHES